MDALSMDPAEPPTQVPRHGVHGMSREAEPPYHPSDLGEVLPRDGAYGVQGKSTWGLSRTCYEMLRIEIKGVERRHLDDLRKEQMWENRGISR